MTDQGVKLTKGIAKWTIAFLLIHFLYSTEEFFRHWIMDGWSDHVVMHGFNAPVTFWLLMVCYPAARELFSEI